VSLSSCVCHIIICICHIIICICHIIICICHIIIGGACLFLPARTHGPASSLVASMCEGERETKWVRWRDGEQENRTEREGERG